MANLYRATLYDEVYDVTIDHKTDNVENLEIWLADEHDLAELSARVDSLATELYAEQGWKTAIAVYAGYSITLQRAES